jgi:hypothetical protein
MITKDYFEKTKGLGVLATADSDGRVDAAIYSRPHVMEDETVAFIMADRTTHANLQTNPHAAYLFVENEGKYEGKRLFLTKVREEKNADLIEKIRRRKYGDLESEDKYLVYFRIDNVVPLVGSGKDVK